MLACSVLLLVAVLAGAEGRRSDDAAFIGVHFGKEAVGNAMNLYLLSDKKESMGAMCLDGTPFGFYYVKAAAPENKDDWQIYFQGGGWCYDEVDCYHRSKTTLGSSAQWPNTSLMDGIMSDNCTINPDFCNFNRVHLGYCDGNSFSGDRTDPVVVEGTKLYFRGKRNILATLTTLMDMGLRSAKRVLLTGCSAGGLATFLHTDFVHTWLKVNVPTLQVFKSAPISGFFLLHDTIQGLPVYPIEMQYIFNLANSTGGLNAQCILSVLPEDRWKCNFAEYAYAYTQAPIFPLNSALDSWQTACIYTSTFPPGFPNQTGSENGVCNSIDGFRECAAEPENCNQVQIRLMNQYIRDFDTIMQSKTVYQRKGNGAFIHSCHTHCEAQSGAWNKFTVNGKTIQQAVSDWWKSNGNDPAEAHTYSPCYYKDSLYGPRKCNPTC